MHNGVFIGKHSEDMLEKVLILAESHHVGTNNPVAGVPADYETWEVIRNDYYKAPTAHNYILFDKIMASFGVEPVNHSQRLSFWESVFFANYIDVLCGIGDSAEKKTINVGNNRLLYNNELFKFLNEKDIGYVFCFSRLVYNNLPGYSTIREYRNQEHLATIECGLTNGKRDYISRCVYLSGIEHDHTDVILNHDVTVYSMRHPSSQCGFDPSKYTETLNPLFSRMKIGRERHVRTTA